MNSKKMQQTLIAFKKKYENNSEELIAERLVMREIEFAKKYKIAPARIKEVMGAIPTNKTIRKGSTKKKLDKCEVNRLRGEGLSDIEIATLLQTSNQDIGIQCGSRRENGFPHGSSTKTIKSPVMVRELNTERWPQECKEEYWKKESNIINQGQGPIKTLNDVKRW